MFKNRPHFTITWLNENEKLTQVFGSENLKTFPGVIRKAEKFITGVHLLEKSLIEKFKFINEGPRYYIHMLKVLNEKSFLELRGYNLGLNEICLKIENVLNEYLNNNQKAA